jgi:DNA-binding transcriptional MocR family regulator
VTNPDTFAGATGSGDLELDINNQTSPKLSDFIQYGMRTCLLPIDNKLLATALMKFSQGNCTGNAQLRQWCLEFTQKVHQPLYKDIETLLHPGNTNAWSKVVGLLCEEGDYILCESYTYPSAQAMWIPLGNFAAPIAMDGQGIRDDELEKTLNSWETDHPGIRRPHVLYLVSVGSNPSGVTMGRERRQKIYDICVRYGKFSIGQT